jgi:hypothetical protein
MDKRDDRAASGLYGNGGALEQERGIVLLLIRHTVVYKGFHVCLNNVWLD